MATLRSIWFWLFFVLWTLLMSTIALTSSLLTLGFARRVLASTLAPLWAKPVFWAAGIRLRFKGLENLRDRIPRVLVMNHGSSLDTFLVCAIGPPGLCPLVKNELKYVPVMGVVFWALGGQFVDRGNSDRAIASVNNLGKAMENEGLTAVIAPEGTRSKDGTLQRFKLGAFHIAKQANAEIVPLVIHGAFELMKPGDWHVHPGEIVADIRQAVRIPDGMDLRDFANQMHGEYARWIDAGPPDKAVVTA